MTFGPGIETGSGTFSGSASDVSMDTTNFDRNLSSSDDTAQKVADTLDDLVAGGGGDLNLDGGFADSEYGGTEPLDGGGA